MLKKKLWVSIFLSSICLTLFSCNKKGGKTADLFYATSTENLMADWNYLDTEDEFAAEENQKYLDRDYTLRYNLMQGEYDGMQLMIHANKYINNFDFKLPTLTGPGGTIEKGNFTVAAVWYQEVESSLERDAFPGFYPDALIPLTNYKWRRMDHIEKGRNQALYINFHSTYDMAPGTYTGEGTLILDKEEIQVPFSVTIYDAKMPEEVHCATSFLIWYEEISNGERENTNNDMLMTYYNYVVSHRISPDGFPEFMESNPRMFAEYYYQLVANNPAITTYRIPTAYTFSIEHYRDILQAMIDKNLEVRRSGDTTTNFFKKLYFYQDDEPNADKFPAVKAHDKAIFDLKKEMCTQLSEYPDLYDSFTHMRNLVTIQYNELLVPTNEEGGVQCWCPQFQHFNSKAKRELYKERQHSTDRDFGENVWWYGCMDPASPYPSFHLDANLITSRIIPYMQFDYEIEGSIYWNLCYYSKQGRNVKTGRDIWHDPMTWVNCAGDGALLYPGIDYGMKEPIPTLRLKSIEASNEEYEYLYMIDQKVNEYNEANSTNLVSRELLNKYLKQLYKEVTPYLDTQVFEEVRLDLLKICEKLNQNLNEGIALLRK